MIAGGLDDWGTSPDGCSLVAAIAAYLDWQALRGSTLNHRKEIARRLHAFAADLSAQMTLEEVTRDQCMALLRRLLEQGRKPNTQFAYYRTLEAFFNWAVADERLARSPMDRVPKPKVPQEPIQPLSEEELSQLLRAPDRSTFVGLRDRAFMALLADSGLRLTEALTIRFADVDAKQRSVSVLGKGSKPQTIFYGATAANCLREYLKHRGTGEADDLLFINSLGERLHTSSMSKRVHDHGVAAGIRGKRVSPHTLRHTFAVFWLLGGGDAFSLQRILGHATAAMTSRYVTFTRDWMQFSAGEGPAHRVSVSAFMLSRNDVTVAEYRRFLPGDPADDATASQMGLARDPSGPECQLVRRDGVLRVGRREAPH